MTLKDPEMARRLWESSRDLLCIADTEGRFVDVNPRFTDVLGWSEEELESRPFLDFVHPEDRQATLDEIDSLSRGIKTLHFENRYLCKDGSWKWLSWNTEPVGNTLFAAARDVTDLKKRQEAEQQQRQAQARATALQDVARQQRLILNAASHELFTPLTPISLASARLRARTANDPGCASALDTIDRGVRKMQTTITSLLYVSQLATERLQVRAERISMSAVLGRAIEATKVNVRPRCERGLAAHIDDVLVEQAVGALIRNAVEHAGGLTALQARATDGGVRIEVVDQGPGFDGEEGETWFIPLLRGDDTQTRPGSGLGLPIVRLVATAHGGSAGVSSPGRGKGTTAWIELPRSL